MIDEWSDWDDFPDPESGGYLHAPFGPGVYELYNEATGEYVLPGAGKNVAHLKSCVFPKRFLARLQSGVPAYFGAGNPRLRTG